MNEIKWENRLRIRGYRAVVKIERFSGEVKQQTNKTFASNSVAWRHGLSWVGNVKLRAPMLQTASILHFKQTKL